MMKVYRFKSYIITETKNNMVSWFSILRFSLTCYPVVGGPLWVLPACSLYPQTPSRGAPVEYPRRNDRVKNNCWMSENLTNLYLSCCIPAVQVQSQKLHPRPILHLWGFLWNPSGRPSKGSSKHQCAGTWRDTSTSLEARRNFSIIKTQQKQLYRFFKMQVSHHKCKTRPSDPRTPSQRRISWSSPVLCQGSLWPQQTEELQDPAAGTWERRAQSPPSWWGWHSTRECTFFNITTHVYHFIPLCTIIIPGDARPWSRLRSFPRGILPFVSRGLKNSAVEVTVYMKQPCLLTHCLPWSLILCSPELLGWPILVWSETSLRRCWRARPSREPPPLGRHLQLTCL